jgi:hypothetical protein
MRRDVTGRLGPAEDVGDLDELVRAGVERHVGGVPREVVGVDLRVVPRQHVPGGEPEVLQQHAALAVPVGMREEHADQEVGRRDRWSAGLAGRARPLLLGDPVRRGGAGEVHRAEAGARQPVEKGGLRHDGTS